MYRVVKEESSMFWEIVVPVILRTDTRMSMRLILSGHRGGVV